MVGKKDILMKRKLKQEKEKKKEEHIQGQITALKEQYDTVIFLLTSNL